MNHIRSTYSSIKVFVAACRRRTRSSIRHTFTFAKKWLLWPAAVVVVVACVWESIEYWVYLVNFWDSLRIQENDRESASTTIRNIGLVVAGLFALGFAVWRSIVAQKQANAAHRQSEVAQQGLLNERYQKGAEMLGSDVPSVRIGGIHALLRLSLDDSEQYYIQIISLLCVFARHPTKDQALDDNLTVLREDVQATLDIIGNRRANEKFVALEEKAAFSLNLISADLRYGDLSRSDLSDAYLRNADFSNGYLATANMSRGLLRGADLSNSKLWFADLSDAELDETNMKYAQIWNANLSGSSLRNTDLSDTQLWGIDFSNAKLWGTNLSGAELYNPRSPRGHESPALGLTQVQLDEARADPDNPPKLDGIVTDAETGQPLIWRGKPLDCPWRLEDYVARRFRNSSLT